MARRLPSVGKVGQGLKGRIPLKELPAAGFAFGHRVIIGVLVADAALVLCFAMIDNEE